MPISEDVEERDGAEERIPEPQAELVVRQQAEPDRRGDDPELERRLFEKRRVSFGLLFGSSQSPISRMRSTAKE